MAVNRRDVRLQGDLAATRFTARELLLTLPAAMEAPDPTREQHLRGAAAMARALMSRLEKL